MQAPQQMERYNRTGEKHAVNFEQDGYKAEGHRPLKNDE